MLAFGPADERQAVAAAQRLIEEGLPFRVMPETLGCVYPLLKGAGWAEVPVFPVERGLGRRAARALERVLDVAVSALVLVTALPLLLVAALVIRLESSGPVLFIQRRVGRNGREFRILKLRTMVADASAAEAKVRAEHAVDPRFVKIPCDPRLTRTGRFLRRTSIDELPQLWNVLRGEMSLVGPRPSQPQEVEHYDPNHFTRLLVKPGVTGMWQVSGRSDLGFEDAAKLDADYVRHWSLLRDLRILARTVVVVLQCRGAC